MCQTRQSHFEQTFKSRSDAETAELARRLAIGLKPGDSVLLAGPIGAGKSHFARAAIRALGVHEDIPSPTFTLVQIYEVAGQEIWHSDLYRLSDPDEIHELGLIAAFETAIAFVEWPELLGPDTPQNAVSIHFELDDLPSERQLRISSTAPHLVTLVQSLHQTEAS